MKFTQSAPPKLPPRPVSNPLQDPALTWQPLIEASASHGLRFVAQADGDGPFLAPPPGNPGNLPEGFSGLVCALTDHSVLSVSGTDAKIFLQGQLTNNLDDLQPGRAQRSGLCSPKGRLIADFIVIQTTDCFLLILSTSLAETIRKRLNMFVLRARVEIQEVTARFLPLGYLAPQAADIGPHGDWSPLLTAQNSADDILRIGLEPVRYRDQAWHRELVLIPASQLAARLASWPADWPLVPTAWWRTGEILAGIPRLTEATADTFVPQMINFELVGGVSFTKGCYPGQEVVARTQYLGKLKRRAAPARLDSTQPVPAGSEITGSDGEPIGTVILSGSGAPFGDPDHQYLLFEARLAEMAASQNAQVDGQVLEAMTLPYAIPAQVRFERPDL